jgi:hypothetical protein
MDKHSGFIFWSISPVWYPYNFRMFIEIKYFDIIPELPYIYQQRNHYHNTCLIVCLNV